MIRRALFALALAACGGPAKHAEEPRELPPAVQAFHDILSPLWHAPESTRRIDDACAAVPALRDGAGDLVIAVPPAGVDEATLRDATAALVSAVDALEAACAAEGRPDVAARFAALHDAYHLVEERATAAP